MTRKEAIEKLRLLDSLTDNEKFSEPIRMAIEALNPWKKLSEEKPPRMNSYWVYGDEGCFRERAFWKKGFWKAGQVLEDITHWCELVGPEEE